MKRIHREVIQWGQGNFVAKRGLYRFTTSSIYLRSHQIAWRSRDVDNRPIIFLCRDHNGMKIESMIDDQFFNRSLWLNHIDFLEIVASCEAQPFASAPHIGQCVIKVRQILTGTGIEMISRLPFSDPLILGMHIKWGGKAEALVSHPDEWPNRIPSKLKDWPGSLDHERNVAVYQKLEDAVMIKMKFNDITICDLSDPA